MLNDCVLCIGTDACTSFAPAGCDAVGDGGGCSCANPPGQHHFGYWQSKSLHAKLPKGKDLTGGSASSNMSIVIMSEGQAVVHGVPTGRLHACHVPAGACCAGALGGCTPFVRSCIWWHRCRLPGDWLGCGLHHALHLCSRAAALLGWPGIRLGRLHM